MLVGTLARELRAHLLDNWFILKEDHGGYESGRCWACGRSGWKEQIEHKGTCLYLRCLVDIRNEMKEKN